VRAELIQLLKASAVFEGFTDDQVTAIGSLVQPVSFAAGEAIVVEGELADCWYLIADGSAAVTQANLIGEPITLAVLGSGDSFGERALVDDRQLRSATVTALTTLEAFALQRSDFLGRVRIANDFREQLGKRLDALAIDTALKRASPYAALPHSALRSLADQLQSQPVRSGEIVIRQGDVGDHLYLIRSGSVEVVKGKRRVAVLRAGDSFGEVAVLTAARRTATVPGSGARTLSGRGALPRARERTLS
jgi:CRP-like cAMP-binding protein